MDRWTPSARPWPTWPLAPPELRGLGLRCQAVRPPLLPPGGIQAWLIGWDDQQETSSAAKSRWLLLSQQEQQRWQQIGTQRGRIRFAASHAARNALLGSDPRRQYVSLSHTDGLAVVVAAHVPIGVDVESDRPRHRWPTIDRFRWPEDPARSWTEFIQRWVAWEAGYKARGGASAASAETTAVDAVVGLVSDRKVSHDHVIALAWASAQPALASST